MTLLTPSEQRTELQEENERRRQPGEPQQETNVGGAERAVSVAAGSILVLGGLGRRSLPGLLIAGVGGALIYRGAGGRCPLYQGLGISTADRQSSIAQRGIHVEQAFLINRPAQDLYRYWKDFQNLPRIMSHLQSVRMNPDGTSHWVARAPWIAGGKVEWDARITRDEPDSLIGWQSLPGSDVDSAGEIRFSKAPGDRGTEVHVFMDYVPPAGRLGHWVATMFGEAPRRQMRDDLRNFKRLMETGELPTIQGQPHGTCTGRGELYFDSSER